MCVFFFFLSTLACLSVHVTDLQRVFIINLIRMSLLLRVKSSNNPGSCLFNTLCSANYTHLTSNTWGWEELASNFPNKAFYYHRQTGFSFLFIRFVFFSRCLLGWKVCQAGIIRDSTVTGAHLIWRSDEHSATQTPDIAHRHGHTCLRTRLLPLVIFVLPPCVVLSVYGILCWAIKAAP